MARDNGVFWPLIRCRYRLGAALQLPTGPYRNAHQRASVAGYAAYWRRPSMSSIDRRSIAPGALDLHCDDHPTTPAGGGENYNFRAPLLIFAHTLGRNTPEFKKICLVKTSRLAANSVTQFVL
jgi:hypothetical protein